MTDTYVIDVQDLGNALDVLMFVLADVYKRQTINQLLNRIKDVSI